MTPSPRIGCSTISFQHLPLDEALSEIAELGFGQIDLGALPGVCDHVPAALDEQAIDRVARTIDASGLRVRSVNGDVGDFNLPEVDRAARDLHLERLLALTARIDADALVLPCGALSHEPIVSLGADLDLVASELLRAARLAEEHGVAIWVESLHYLRLCFDRERADALHARLAGSGIRPVLDVAHVVAAGDDVPALVAGWGEAIAHVHLRDAIAGDFNRPFGTGEVDFAEAVRALDAIGFDGAYALELPSAAYDDDATGAIDDEARLAKKNLVAAAAELMTPLLDAGPAIEGATP